MARSAYVYVLTWKDHAGSSAPILTATVKREFIDGLARAGSQLDDTDVWRMRDGELLERTHLGSGAEYLATERPPAVAAVAAIIGDDPGFEESRQRAADAWRATRGT